MLQIEKFNISGVNIWFHITSTSEGMFYAWNDKYNAWATAEDIYGLVEGLEISIVDQAFQYHKIPYEKLPYEYWKLKKRFEKLIKKGLQPLDWLED